MKNRSYALLFAFLAFILAVSLACGGLTTTSATQQPVSNNSGNSNQDQPTVAPTQASTTGSSDLVTFTDKNKYYQIQVPSDWAHTESTDTKSNNYYIDTFKSPDGNALIENIAYDDGTPFPGGSNGKFALQILHQFYSNTGKEGDIKVTDDSIQKDGSERLVWNSKSGSYTGISFFEVRKGTLFLMFTVEYANSSESQYLDLLNKVIESYVVP